MTTGIAIPIGGHVVLASGSRVLADTHLMPNMNKIVTLELGYMTLGAGCLKAFRSCFREYELLAEVGDFDNIIRIWCDKISDLNIESDDGAEFLVAKGCRLWLVDTDGTYYENITTPMTVGSGADMAKGFLGGSPRPKTVEQAKKLALKALHFVSQHMVCEGPPFTVEVT